MRLGAMLLSGGVVCALLAVGLPLLEVGGEAVTSADSEGMVAFDVMSDHRAVGTAAFAALAVWGVLMMMEGRGGNTLRRLLPWHAEVRATAVHALALTLALVGLLEMGTVWGITAYETSITSANMILQESSTSPAGVAATLVALSMVLWMLFMTAYSSTFAVYRGGGNRRTLAMAKLSMGIVTVCMLALVMLHVGRIVAIEADITYPRIVQGVAFSVHGEYSLGDIEVQAFLEGGGGGVEALMTALSMLSWTLFATLMLGLAGSVGSAAMGMRSLTRRVHLALAAPFIAGLSGIAAGIAGSMAVFLTPSIVADILSEMYLADMTIEFDIYVGLVLILGVVITMVVVVLAIVFAIKAGPSTMLIALGLEPAPMAQGPNPLASGATGTLGARGRTPVVPIVAVAVMLVVASGAWGYMTLSGAMRDAFGADEVVRVEDLDDYGMDYWIGEVLSDGEMTFYEVLLDGLQPTQGMGRDDVAVYFIDTIDVMLVWEDEPDTDRRFATWENQPDTFLLELTDDSGLVTLSGQESNVHGQQGSVHLRWEGDADGCCLGIGLRFVDGEREPATSEFDARVEGTEVYWDDDVIARVTLVDTGDMTNPRRLMTYQDTSNEFTLHVSVSGKVLVMSP